jgi:6-phosphogluconolactonase
MELVHAPVPDLKRLLTELFEEATANREGKADRHFACALSGGPSALLFLPALRVARVDWSRVTLFWADERAGAADDPESNYGIAERMLLAPLGAKAPRAFRMPTEFPLRQAALKYDAALAVELAGAALDLAILGVGEDGHVCSLFPGHKALIQDDLRAVAVEDAPHPPAYRLSLTLPFIVTTSKIWLIAVGPRKLPALQAALSKTHHSTPLDLLLQHARDVTVFTDQAIRRR